MMTRARARPRAKRLGCFRERIRPFDLGTQVSLVDETGELDQLRAGRTSRGCCSWLGW
jgi:hypothetical protein